MAPACPSFRPLFTHGVHFNSRLIIGLPHRLHFLGVNNKGYRLSPAPIMMLPKQQQMNDMLKRVIDALDKDTPLVALED